MTTLSVYLDNGEVSIAPTRDFTTIAKTLGDKGVLFERWEATQPLSSDAQQDEVLAAYDQSIKQLKNQFDIQSVDVVALQSDNPQKKEFREKFLAEHTHKDFEIRFFVDGSGLFYLHIEDKVYFVLCEKGDLISVPANTTHWFDMGENPSFKCIRLFSQAEGWLADFTDSDIAKRFPSMDKFVASLS